MQGFKEVEGQDGEQFARYNLRGMVEALTTSVTCKVVVDYMADSNQSDDLALSLTEPAVTLRDAELAAVD